MVYESKITVDLKGLLELARSRNIKVIEVGGLDDRSGLRFQKSGIEWIALNSALADSEKRRALGFLLENDSSGIGVETSKFEGSFREPSGLLSLRCPGI